jgi:hypothetical protein
MTRQRATIKGKSSNNGKKRKEAAVEYEDVPVTIKRLGKTVMRSRPVDPSKSNQAGPSNSRAQSVQHSQTPLSSAEASSNFLTDDIMLESGWYQMEDISNFFTDKTTLESGWYQEEEIEFRNTSAKVRTGKV